MTPISFEWQWNVEYFIFFGLLYLALTIVGGTAAVAFIKTWLDLMKEKNEESELPKIEKRLKYTDY